MSDKNNQQKKVEKAKFNSLSDDKGSTGNKHNLDLLLDIELDVHVELGRTKMSVKEVLALSKGSTIILDKLAGEPVDILVNGTFIAKGEIVVIDDQFGIRINDILNKKDRMKRLR